MKGPLERPAVAHLCASALTGWQLG